MLQYLPIYYYYTQLEMIQKRATEPYGLMPACTNINNPTQWKIYTNPPEYTDYGIYIKPPIPNEKVHINRKRTIESVLQTEIKYPIFSQVNVNDHTLPGELTSFEVRDAHDINRRLRDQTLRPANNLYNVGAAGTQRQAPPASMRPIWSGGGSAPKIPNNPANTFYSPPNSDDDMMSGGEDDIMDMNGASYGPTIVDNNLDPSAILVSPKCESGKRIFVNKYFNDPQLVKNIGTNHRMKSFSIGTYPKATEIDNQYFEAIYNNDMVTALGIYEQGKLLPRTTQRMTRLRPESYMLIMDVLELNFYNNLSFNEFQIACRINRQDINGKEYNNEYNFSSFALYLALPVLREKISTYENFNGIVISEATAQSLMDRTNYDPEETQLIETLRQFKSRGGLTFNATLGACRNHTIEIMKPIADGKEMAVYYTIIFSSDGRSFTPIQMQREIYMKKITAATPKITTRADDYDFPYPKVGHRVRNPTIYKQNEYLGRALQTTFTKTALDTLYSIPV